MATNGEIVWIVWIPKYIFPYFKGNEAAQMHCAKRYSLGESLAEINEPSAKTQHRHCVKRELMTEPFSLGTNGPVRDAMI